MSGNMRSAPSQLLQGSSPLSLSTARCALQLAVGQFLVALPVVIAFPNFLSKVAWIGTINYPAPLFLLSADKHSGTQVLAALKMTGDLCLGSFVAGIAVSLAQLPGVAYTEFMCLFTALGLVLFACARARIPAAGMMSTLMFGITMLLGQFTAKEQLWKEVAGYLVLINIITGASAVIPALLVMPTTARSEAMQLLPCIAQSMGRHVSEYASALVSPAKVTANLGVADQIPRVDKQHGEAMLGAAMPPSLNTLDRLSASQQEAENVASASPAPSKSSSPSLSEPAPTAESIRQGIMQETDPGRQLGLRLQGLHHPQSSISSLRPLLVKAKRLVHQSQFELWVPVNQRRQIQLWDNAIEALDRITLTAAALESVLEGEAPLLTEGSMSLLLKRMGVLQDFQIVYAQLTASCSAMADAIASCSHPDAIASCSNPYQVGAGSHLLLGSAWPALEHELAEAVQQALHEYWRSWREQQSDQGLFAPEIQSRALLYLFTLTHSVMGAMAAAEHAIELVLEAVVASKPGRGSKAILTQSHVPHQGAAQQSSVPLEQPSGAITPATVQSSGQQQTSGNAESQPEGLKVRRRSLHQQQLQQQSGGLGEQADGQSSETQPLIARPEGLLRLSVEQRPAKQHFDRLGVEVAVAVTPIKAGQTEPSGQAWMRWAWAQLRLLWPALQALLASTIWLDWLRLSREAFHTFSSKQLRSELLRSRKFQYGVKYWALNTLVLCCALLFSDLDQPGHLADWHPLFLVATVNVVFSEKVDASLAKGIQRISGSVLGCVYGFLIMLSPAVASNPYAVTAFACLSAFVCGLYAQHRFNYGAFLALYTSAVVILAQYTSSPGNHGSVKFFYARIADICMGVIITSTFTLVKPWYAREDALGRLGQAVAEGAQLIHNLYFILYEELQQPMSADQRAGSTARPDEQPGSPAPGTASIKGMSSILAAVQAQVAKEAVVWRSGPLVMAPLVKSTLAATEVLLERIAALEAMTQQAPIVSGSYTPAPFLHLAQPLHPHMSAAMHSQLRLGRAIKGVLSAHASRKGLAQPLQELKACIPLAVETRVAFRLKYWELRANDHAQARTPANSPWLRERTLDDAVRYLSYVFAAGKASDKVILLARMVESDPWIQKSSAMPAWLPWHLWHWQSQPT